MKVACFKPFTWRHIHSTLCRTNGPCPYTIHTWQKNRVNANEAHLLGRYNIYFVRRIRMGLVCKKCNNALGLADMIIVPNHPPEVDKQSTIPPAIASPPTTHNFLLLSLYIHTYIQYMYCSFLIGWRIKEIRPFRECPIGKPFLKGIAPGRVKLFKSSPSISCCVGYFFVTRRRNISP